MSQLHNPFVLAYHGCEKEIGLQAINGKIELLRSEKPFDWLGSGTYFWEGDPMRALEWAEEKKARGQIKEPFAVGAAINLGHCLDLLTREDCELVRDAAAFLRRSRRLPKRPCR